MNIQECQKEVEQRIFKMKKLSQVLLLKIFIIVQVFFVLITLVVSFFDTIVLKDYTNLFVAVTGLYFVLSFILLLAKKVQKDRYFMIMENPEKGIIYYTEEKVKTIHSKYYDTKRDKQDDVNEIDEIIELLIEYRDLIGDRNE